MITIKKSSKAQAGIETIAAVGIVLVIFMLMCFFAYHISSEKKSAEERSMAENSCLELSTIISSLRVSSPGAEFRIRTNSTATFESGKGISVRYGDKEAFCSTPVQFTNGIEGSFTFAGGNLTIRNNNGMIIIEKD